MISFRTARKIFNKELSEFEKQRKEIRRLWNIDENTAEFLFFMVKLLTPERILEIGTSNGYSTFWLSVAAEHHKGMVHTIEIDDFRYNLAKSNLKTRDNIIQYHGLAEEIIPKFTNNFDLVFIDAGKIGYIDYVKLLSEKLNENALLIADNAISHKETVKEYIDFVDKHYPSWENNIGSGLKLSIFPQGEK